MRGHVFNFALAFRFEPSCMTAEQFAPFPREVRLRPSRQPTVQKNMMLQANDILEHLKGEMAHRTEPLIGIGADDDNGIENETGNITDNVDHDDDNANANGGNGWR